MLKKTLLLATGIAILAACTPTAPDTTSADEAALKADPLAWMAAYNAGDADGVASLYADDGILLPPGNPAAVGRAAIREFLVADLANAKAAGLTFNHGEHTGVGVSGDLGWLSGTFSVTAASGSTVDKGKYLSVFRRIDGNWQLIRDTWNSDTPPIPAAPAVPEAAAAVEPVAAQPAG